MNMSTLNILILKIIYKWRKLLKINTVFMLIMNFILLFLHLYWTFFMLKVVYNGIFKEKAKIEYDRKDRDESIKY